MIWEDKLPAIEDENFWSKCVIFEIIERWDTYDKDMKIIF